MDTTDQTVRPFSNGTQYMDWQCSNCDSCKKQAPADASLDKMPCEIEAALVLACLGDGRIPLPIWDRMGHDEQRYVWPCKEHDPPFVNVIDGHKVDPARQ